MTDATDAPYRLGLDVGSNSLGWFVVWLDDNGDPIQLGPGGARIYPDGRDPQSKTSNAVSRRVARGARRRRDRYLKRRTNLMAQLVTYGLMPRSIADKKALENLDPYQCRARALDETLTAHQIGRALFHLNQRRGFLSNRKTEKNADDDKGAIKEANRNLENLMRAAGARTLGEFFFGRQRTRQYVRARNRSTGTKAEYEFYPTRQLLRDEFDAIWRRQAPYHSEMTEEARAAIHHTIFFQRPLKRPQAGKCSLDPARNADDLEGFRCPRAHPLAQRFRIWQEVRNLEFAEAGKPFQPLTKERGDKIALALMEKGKLSFDRIRSILKLPAEAHFNLESPKRKELLGDETAARLAKAALFGKAWYGFSVEQQIAIVSQLLEVDDERQIIAWLVAEAGLDEAKAEAIASVNFHSEGHSRLGLRAIKKILPYMIGGMMYPDAAKAAGYDPALLPTGEVSPSGYLPYYGEWLQNEVIGTGDPRDSADKRFGRFPNPTVHIGLGQLRRVVNAVIRDLGHAPAQVTVEMTRDFKLSPDQMVELEREQAQNQRKNEARREELRKLGQPDNARNLIKMRLWEELNSGDLLDRRCPFSGEPISIARLLSEEVEIEHLIPFSQSWDDSAANKVVCLRSANRLKGKQTPYEAFGATPEWDDIAKRAASLPKNKRWRFAPDARQRFDAMGGFLARQLNETGWLARVAAQYVAAVTGPYKVNVLPGKMTAMIRAKWGLNSLLPDHNYSDAKNRKDHRHHAIDAMVAALTDRSLLQRMASANDAEERERIEIPPPWPTLRDDLDAKLSAMVVSHKADHGLEARLHEDSAYGTVVDDTKSEGNLVYRKTFLTLTEKEIGRIRDRRLRDLVEAHVKARRAAAEDLKAALQSFAARTDIPGLPNGVRHVRLLKAEKPEYLVTLKDRSGKPYKSYSAGENAYVEIFETVDGRWHGEAMTIFRANQKGSALEWSTRFAGARFVMRVFKGDMLNIAHEGRKKLVRIVRLSPSNNVLYLVEHNEAGEFQKRHDDKDDPFRWIFANFDKLREWSAELVRVDEIGRPWRVEPKGAATEGRMK